MCTWEILIRLFRPRNMSSISNDWRNRGGPRFLPLFSRQTTITDIVLLASFNPFDLSRKVGKKLSGIAICCCKLLLLLLLLLWCVGARFADHTQSCDSFSKNVTHFPESGFISRIARAELTLSRGKRLEDGSEVGEQTIPENAVSFRIYVLRNARDKTSRELRSLSLKAFKCPNPLAPNRRQTAVRARRSRGRNLERKKKKRKSLNLPLDFVRWRESELQTDS